MIKNIYIHDTKVHNTTAATEILPIVFSIFSPQSVVDVGCGIGTWLKIAKELGSQEILGIDGDYIDYKLLEISKKNFLPYDLTKEFKINKKFDLVISLEVAEHLPETSAEMFVKTLTSLGDNILFSAAIVNQDGQNHLNEQFYSYWQEKFEKYGFKFYDIIRPQIWWNKNIDWWYAQNIFLVSKNDLSFYKLKEQCLICGHHPTWYIGKKALLNNIETGNCGIRFAIELLKKAIKQKIKRLLNA